MPRKNNDDMFSSSPAHPSHHGTNSNLNPRNPYATAQRNLNLKRTAEVAALPSPPRTQAKRKHFAQPALDDPDDDVVDLQMTPTKSTTTRPRRRLNDSPEQATPKGRTIRAKNAPPAGASPALSISAIQEAGARSPSPFPYREDAGSPPPLVRRSRRSANKQLLEFAESASDSDSAESVDAPLTPTRQRERAPATPPPTRRTRATAKGPIRDSPNNPFLSTSPRFAKKAPLEAQNRDSISYVFRGMKVPREHVRAVPQRAVSPSNSDYSPGADFVPKLLFPSMPESPTPRAKTRTSTRLSQSPSSKTTKRVARNLFAAEIASASARTSAGKSQGPPKPKPQSWAESSTSSGTSSVSESHGALNAKAKALKQGIRKGVMSTSMVIAHVHGPVRPRVAKREDTFGGPLPDDETLAAHTKTTRSTTTTHVTEESHKLAPSAAIFSAPRRSPRGLPSSRTTAAAHAAVQHK